MQQLIKVQWAMQALTAEPDLNLADLAAAGGFSDQAHFSRCFRSFVGLTPNRFARLNGQMHDQQLDIWAGLDPAFKHRPSPPVIRFR